METYLTFIEEVGRNRHGAKMCRYKCECGNEIVTLEARVKKFLTKSCGCLKIKHSLTKHPLYTIWAGMKQRCYDSTTKVYKNYGGRGIFVCAEWVNDFKTFFDWAISAGWLKGLQIDRINNESGYSPMNCRFATPKVNSSNRRSTRWFIIEGFKLNLLQASIKYNIPKQTLHNRLKKNASIEECLRIRSKTTLINHSFGHIN